jgi:hypothetical protein
MKESNVFIVNITILDIIHDISCRLCLCRQVEPIQIGPYIGPIVAYLSKTQDFEC